MTQDLVPFRHLETLVLFQGQDAEWEERAEEQFPGEAGVRNVFKGHSE